ncbi:SDR family NAD(P)-dependent oxidoreductase [Pseudarthrobacter sp. S9]|uniref:SDR family NAD(P)-dependent oxidoreductase n=1 Tax=Pseudarthrobacter sp. S9 TaxID=3418421 RepID=UPI003D00520E
MSSLIRTPFTAQSTAREVVEGVELTGRRAIVTGGASGLGTETARALAGAGAEVTLAVRDPGRAKDVVRALRTEVGRERIVVAALDLADPVSISRFVREWSGPLHILVANAGVMAPPETRTSDGWELQFATNHLGHFALATSLLPALRAASDARVVVVSSAAHLAAPLDFDDIRSLSTSYDPQLAYGRSKTANVLFAVAAHERWAADDITVNTLQPGSILTALSRHLPPSVLAVTREDPSKTFSTAEQGAATSVLLAASPTLRGLGGRYFEYGQQAPVVNPPFVTREGVAGHAMDPDSAARLWAISTEVVGG